MAIPVVTKNSDEESANEKSGHEDRAPSLHASPLSEEVEKVDLHPIEGAWAEPKNLYIIFR